MSDADKKLYDCAVLTDKEYPADRKKWPVPIQKRMTEAIRRFARAHGAVNILWTGCYRHERADKPDASEHLKSNPWVLMATVTLKKDPYDGLAENAIHSQAKREQTP